MGPETVVRNPACPVKIAIMMIEFLSDPHVWLSFATLALLEIILGIDNIIFISIIAERLPKEQRQRARLVGLALALLMRVVLLLSLTWIIRLTAPVITAVGMVQNLPVMIAAVVVAIVIMMIAAAPVAAFVERHLSIKMLALSFLVLIGMVLVADGLGFHIPKGYVYASVGFSLAVQALVLIANRRRAARRS